MNGLKGGLSVCVAISKAKFDALYPIAILYEVFWECRGLFYKKVLCFKLRI